MYGFYICRSRKRKKIPMTQLYFFTLSGSTSIKAARKTLVKLTPEEAKSMLYSKKSKGRGERGGG